MRITPAGPITPAAVRVTLGVDTHADVHVAAALDGVGRLRSTRTVPTTTGGDGRGGVGAPARPPGAGRDGGRWR